MTWLGGSVARAQPKRARLQDLLREHFSYLQLSDEVLDAFVRDHERVGRSSGPKGRAIPVPSRFLLSTDFFQNGADESRPVNYVAFHGAYTTPCYNPLIPSSMADESKPSQSRSQDHGEG